MRSFTRWAIGGSVAALLCASSLPAQVDTTRRDTLRTPRSSPRIPIRKESGGEVMPNTDSLARADSIARAQEARDDSIAAAERARTDSLARMEQARLDSIAQMEKMRNDSIARASAAPPPQVMTTRRLPGSFYMGLAGGVASPQGDVQDLGYGGGFNLSVPIGWHNPAALLGWRLMLAYSQFDGGSFITDGTSPVVLSNSDPQVYSAELNLNIRFPFNWRRTSSVYLSGGGGAYVFRNFGQGSALAGYLGNDVLDPDDSANETTVAKWGVNGGAGLEFGIGTSSLFLETRLVNVFAGRDDEPGFDSVFGERGTSVRWVPFIIGFTIR